MRISKNKFILCDVVIGFWENITLRNKIFYGGIHAVGTVRTTKINILLSAQRNII